MTWIKYTLYVEDLVMFLKKKHNFPYKDYLKKKN